MKLVGLPAGVDRVVGELEMPKGWALMATSA